MSDPPRGAKSDLRAAMVAQLRYAKHGVASTTVSTQCDTLTAGSSVLKTFCQLVGPLDVDRSKDLVDWATTLDEGQQSVGGKATTRESLIVDFCAALVGFLELNLGHATDEDGDAADGLRASERRTKYRAMLTSPMKQQVEAQAAKILALDEEMRRTKAKHLQQISQLEAVGRENVRFAVHNALEQAKGTASNHGAQDANGLRYENVSMSNKLRLRDLDVERLAEEVKLLQCTLESRDLEIANLEIALVKVSADREHHKEDVVRTNVIDHSRIDESIASLNGKVANFAETVMTYAAALREMEMKHSATLRRQTVAHETLQAALESELASLRRAVADRDAKIIDIMRENAVLSSRIANRAIVAARSNAVASQRTPAFVSKVGPIADSPGAMSSQPTPRAMGSLPASPRRRLSNVDDVGSSSMDNPRMPASQLAPRRPSSIASPVLGSMRRKVSFTAFASTTPTHSHRATPDAL